jgi:hypothetical protein
VDVTLRSPAEAIRSHLRRAADYVRALGDRTSRGSWETIRAYKKHRERQLVYVELRFHEDQRPYRFGPEDDANLEWVIQLGPLLAEPLATWLREAADGWNSNDDMPHGAYAALEVANLVLRPPEDLNALDEGES